MSEKISVIIPCHNDAATIKQTIDSILDQRSVVVEIIVVDDGSTDGTREVLSSLPQNSIRIIHQPQQGAPAARNNGAAISTGAYLFFCDADVVLRPHALQILHRALVAHPEAAFSYGGFLFDGRQMRAVRFSHYWLERMNYISTMSLLRRSAFPGFDTSLRRFQDWDLWLRIVKKNAVGTAIPDILFHTLPHARASISSAKNDREAAELVIRRKHGLPGSGFGKHVLWKIGFALYRAFFPVL